jgi:(p)ppGpp synthase/HD superfamily hydrolase
MTCALDDPNMNRNVSILEETLTIAALHDVFEDRLATLEEIAMLFGQDIATSVDALSRIDNSGKERPYGVYYGNLYGQPEQIKLLKGWDRWLNLRKWKVELETSTLSRLYRGEEEKARERYVRETDDFVYTLVGSHPLREMIQTASNELMAA